MITQAMNFWEKISLAIYSDNLEFVIIKFNLKLPFIQFFTFYWLKIRIYIVHKYKIHTMFRANAWQQKTQDCNENTSQH